MFNKVLIIFTRFNYQRCGKSQTDRVSDTWGKTCCFLNVNRLITKSRKVQDNCFLKFYRVNNMKLIKCLQ